MSRTNGIVADGEVYYTASEAAKYLHISRCMFYYNVKANVQAYKFGASRRLLYKRSELEPFRCIQPASVRQAS